MKGHLVANDVSSNPWYLDTPTPSTAPPKPGLVKVMSIAYIGYASNTNFAVVKGTDGKGNVKLIMQLEGKSDQTPDWITFPPTFFRDLFIDAASSLGGGYVLVYLGY